MSPGPTSLESVTTPAVRGVSGSMPYNSPLTAVAISAAVSRFISTVNFTWLCAAQPHGQRCACPGPAVDFGPRRAHGLSCLMPLSRDQHGGRGLCLRDRLVDGPAPVGHLNDLFHTCAPAGHLGVDALPDGGADHGRVLGTGIVVGENDHIGFPRRGPAHVEALAAVAVAAGAEDDDELIGIGV